MPCQQVSIQGSGGDGGNGGNGGGEPSGGSLRILVVVGLVLLIAREVLK